MKKSLLPLFVVLIAGLLFSCEKPHAPSGRNFPDAAREIFLINGNAESISVLNADTLEMHSHVMLTGTFPNDLVYYQDRLFVVNSGSNSISVYDESTFSLIGEVDLGSGRNPMKLIVDDAHQGWIPNLLRGSLSVIDMDTLELIISGEEEIMVGAAPEGGCYLNNRIFVCNTGGFNSDTGGFNYNGSLTVINKQSYEELETLDLGPDTNPRSAQAFPDLNQVHVYLNGLNDQDDGKILVYQVPAGEGNIEQIGTYDIGGNPSFSGSARDSVHQRVFLSGQGGVSAYNPQTMEILYSSDSFLYPASADYSILFGGVAVDSVLDRVLITDFNNDSLYLLEKDGERYNLIETLDGDDGVQIPLLVEE